MEWYIGQPVKRIQDSGENRAVIIDLFDDYVELQYREGGTGTWPYDCIEPDLDTEEQA